MAAALQWIDSIKQKKFDIASFLFLGKYNHPHRLATVDLSGSLSYTVDERAFTVNASPSDGNVAFVYSYSLTLTGITGYTRMLETRYPWVNSPTAGFVVGEFAMAHKPHVKFWEVLLEFGTLPDYEVVGTATRDRYVYGSGSWGFDSTNSVNIEIGWDLSITNGGDATSGGKDDESDDENCLILATIDWIGSYSENIPVLTTPAIKRFPWDDSWAAESSAFSDSFNADISARNTADGAGHSGTCTVSLDFT